MKIAHFGAALTICVGSWGLAGCGLDVAPTNNLAADGDDSTECFGAEDWECEAEKEILRLNNEYRANSDRDALTESGHMGFVSRDWSKKQAARGSIGHDGFPSRRTSVYTDSWDSMEGKSVSGENVAYFTGGNDMTGEEAGAKLARMWWNSSSHRANMLGGHSGLGNGVYRTSSGSVYGTQIFYRQND